MIYFGRPMWQSVYEPRNWWMSKLAYFQYIRTEKQSRIGVRDADIRKAMSNRSSTKVTSSHHDSKIIWERSHIFPKGKNDMVHKKYAPSHVWLIWLRVLASKNPTEIETANRLWKNFDLLVLFGADTRNKSNLRTQEAIKSWPEKDFSCINLFKITLAFWKK